MLKYLEKVLKVNEDVVAFQNYTLANLLSLLMFFSKKYLVLLRLERVSFHSLIIVITVLTLLLRASSFYSSYFLFGKKHSKSSRPLLAFLLSEASFLFFPVFIYSLLYFRKNNLVNYEGNLFLSFKWKPVLNTVLFLLIIFLFIQPYLNAFSTILEGR